MQIIRVGSVKEMTKQIIVIGNLDDRDDTVLAMISRIYSRGGAAPVISTMTGGNRQPKTVRKWDTNISKSNKQQNKDG